MGNSTGKPTTAFMRRPQSKEFSLLEKELQDQFATPICLPLDFLKAITSDFSEEQELGRGGFGVVYKGILKNGKAAIAVKKLSEMHLDDDQFQNEVTYLIGLKHQNIVKLVGYCAESRWEATEVGGKYVMAEVRKRLLCFEYINNKSLDKHISVPTAESYGFGWNIRYEIISGICCGLHYLHTECQIVHLDLKPQNILLDDNMEPKIADFGMSRLFGQQQSRIITESRGGTPGYMAPEYLSNGLISIKADIFSLGVIIIELMTGRRDYPGTEESFEHFVENVVGSWRKRLEETYKSAERYAEQVKTCILMGLMCVDADPNKRPTAGDILEKLSKPDVTKMNIELPEKQLVHFDGSIGFTLEDLLRADTEVLGKSTFWTVYKAQLENGSFVAFRRFRLDMTKGLKEFEDETAVLGSIPRHPNLLPLFACFVSQDEKLIVFNYMPTGSLLSYLHGAMSRPVDWATRIEIVTGVARGLTFLHDDMSIIHGNLTARNVLLDEESSHSKIADFGLFRLMSTAANSSLLDVATRMGYRAPELSNLMMASAKTDVYNLGIIILELLTGKLPSSMDLPQWVASVVRTEWTDAFDMELMQDGAAAPSVDELMGTLMLALQCVNPSPSMRPQAREVLEKLEKTTIPTIQKNISEPSEDPSPSSVQLEVLDKFEFVRLGPEDGAEGTSEDLFLSVRIKYREVLKELMEHICSEEPEDDAAGPVEPHSPLMRVEDQEEELEHVLSGPEVSQEALLEPLEVEQSWQIQLGPEDHAVQTEDGSPFVGIENQEVLEQVSSGSEDGNRTSRGDLLAQVQIHNGEVLQLQQPGHTQSGAEDGTEASNSVLSMQSEERGRIPSEPEYGAMSREGQLPLMQHENGEVFQQSDVILSSSGPEGNPRPSEPEDREVLQQPEPEQPLSPLVRPEVLEEVLELTRSRLVDHAEPGEDRSVLEPPEENGGSSEPESGRGRPSDDPPLQPEVPDVSQQQAEHVEPQQPEDGSGPNDEGGAAHARPFIISLFFICFPFVVREIR